MPKSRRDFSVPPPRNSVEIPLFVFRAWGFWPPLRLCLGIPYRDADDRFTTHRLESTPATPKADLTIRSVRHRRRGPKRASGSEQLILDIGAAHPSRALALVLLWRDLGVVGGELGATELRTPTSSWWARQLPSREARVRQQRRRLRKLLGTIPPAQWMPTDPADLRRAAVIAARGTAARCGGPRSAGLLRDAFGRYSKPGDDLSEIQLPDEDLYRYEFDVRHLVHHFVSPGGRLANYVGEYTHVLVVGEDPVPDVEDSTLDF